MEAAAFIRKWSDSKLRERQGSQSHFNDLCAVLGVPNPTDADPSGDDYAFERGAEKVGGGDGWADVWRRGCFGWEYKGKHKNLNAALRQLQAYALDLDNPPYLVVSDMERIVIRTNWTNTPSRSIELVLRDLYDPTNLDLLRDVLNGSERLKPGQTRQELTDKVAAEFGELSRRLQDRTGPGGRLHNPRDVAHFLNRLIFCMFAEDAELLPPGLFTRLLKGVLGRPDDAQRRLSALFREMAAGGDFGADAIPWFNGGLFDDDTALRLELGDLDLVHRTAAENDWSQIDPAIFGTLFEIALTATRERAARGAHYTDREKIEKIVDPVIRRPLFAEWERVRAGIAADMSAAAEAERGAAGRDKAAPTPDVGALFSLPRSGKGQAGAAGQGGEPAAEPESPGGDASLASTAPHPGALRAPVPPRKGEGGNALALRQRARRARDAFLDRLQAFRVLDPACGSGNFLYLALYALKDIEQRAIVDASLLGLDAAPPRVGVDNLLGIEVEPYAAELARLTLWIGDLQWRREHGYRALEQPVLAGLHQIERRDALLNADGSVAEWPAADVIVGNPPFVGGKKLRTELGDTEVERLFAAYRGRVPAEADLVAYWVEKAWRAVSVPHPLAGEGDRPSAPDSIRGVEGAAASADAAAETRDDGSARPAPPPPPQAVPLPRPLRDGGGTVRAGLVATNSIRGGASRRVLDPIAEADALWEAWDDEPWNVKGAAVRVSILGFGSGFVERRLDGAPVARINADLTSGGLDLTAAKRLKENAGVAFQGPVLIGAFQISGDQARDWLNAPLNPNGRPNSDVLRPVRIAADVTGRPRDHWIVDFQDRDDDEANLYERPFQYALVHIAPTRTRNRRAWRAAQWWKHGERGEGWRNGVRGKPRYVATPRVSRHRVFVWLPTEVFPDSRLFAFTRDDDTTLGLLHSRPHEVWSLGTASWHGVGNDPTYNAKSCFETFPFPEGLTPDLPAADYAEHPHARAIGEAAAELDRLREAWLNPADLVRREPEVVPGYPDRVLPRDEAAADQLKARTLTKLYNERPAWLDMAHRRLDAAVAAAYGWPADLADSEVLQRLFDLNQERATAGR